MLQRRLASSPEAIYQSLKRRRERLENRLSEARLLARGEKARQHLAETLGTYYVARQIDLPESDNPCALCLRCTPRIGRVIKKVSAAAITA